jgi:alkyldihydroxyacetonephosphate synthase
MARAPHDPDELVGELAKIVGPRRVSIAQADLETYSRDMWPRLLLAVREGAPPEQMPNAVVWPESIREVAAVVRLARSKGVPIVPYGGGSGVCGGAVPIRGGITVDLKRMDQLLGVRRDEMLCDVEAGMNGERFERELDRRGYTFGNFPSSIYCSTVGGWLATRAAGQMSTKYGKVEDRIAGLTVVTGRGEVIETDGLARSTRGPSWSQMIAGSEGTLGVITSARLRLASAPALRVLRGFEVEDVAHGVEAIRRVMQRGLRPAVVRLYDELDTFIHGFGDDHPEEIDDSADRRGPIPEPGDGALPHLGGGDGDGERPGGVIGRMVGLLGSRERGRTLSARNLRRSLRQEAMATALSHPRLLNGLAGSLVEKVTRKGCRLIVGIEGARIRTEVEANLVIGELERAGARNMGEDPGREWLAHRYSVSYKMSPVFRDGAFVDTMEVASTWERLLDMYDAVRAAIGRHAMVMAHFSHAYPEGCSIYFTFAGHANNRRASEKLYDTIWREGLAATTRVGGTISHHHGVGLLKAAHMTAEHREAMSILRALKQTMDPDNIMNPGKLGLPADLGGAP